MMALFHRCLMLLAGACCTLPLAIVPSVVSAADSSPSASGPLKRWAGFEFSQSDATGNLQVGRAVTLTITLGGVVQGSAPVVALCESVLFEKQIVTLEPDSEDGTLKGTVTLEPMPMSRTSIHPKASRIQVTFNRSRQDKLERFMRRIVYVTLDRQDQASDAGEAPPIRPEEPSTTDLVEEIQPDALPVTGSRLVEEDLMPFADPSKGKAYWQHVSQLISRSWARQVRGVRRGPSSETVRVRFQLFANGRAQLIEIEKGSGAREIDEAGIYAVVNAQPFPPLPTDIGDDAIDVHVRMRTGARPRPRDVQSITNQSSQQPDAPGQAPKK